MSVGEIIHGRRIGPAELAEIRQLVGDHADWSRRRISVELSELWQWRTPAGVLRDMAARHLLGKLEARGLISLPARQPGGGRRPSRFQVPADHQTEPLECSLEELRPLQITLVEARTEQAKSFGYYLHHHHYLGYELPIGLNLRYLVSDAQGRALACLLFGAAAWKVAARDRFIGWSPGQRQQRVNWLANNTRFLILPWVRAPHLASHVLGAISRRIAADWQGKYQAPLLALETFVERGRFTGACYRAANWQLLGQSTGRGRADTEHTSSVPIKDIYLYPLRRRWRQELCRQ